MKKCTLISVFTFLLIFSSCGSSKNAAQEALFNTLWELEYMSGPRIAFEGLFPNKKPQITFHKETGEVSGSGSCNGYASKFTLNGKALTFGEQYPTTMMFCDGGGEAQFTQTIKKVDSYSIDSEGKLNLFIRDVPFLRFKKIEN
jgi:heat shock protein HslJ